MQDGQRAEEVKIGFILGVLSQGHITSGTDSSCAFCGAYGGEPHQAMDEYPHEYIVLTAGKLIRRELG